MSSKDGRDLAREREWLTMPLDDLRDCVARIVWGYESERLSLDELYDGCNAAYGWPTANRFVAALGMGCKKPTLSRVWSFAGICVSYGDFRPLERLLDLPESTLQRGFSMSKALWLDHLCTREPSGGPGTVVRWSIWRTGNDVAKAGTEAGFARARKCFELGLRLQPSHPDIQAVMGEEGPGRAILAELLMGGCINSPSASVTPLAPEGRRPRARSL